VYEPAIRLPGRRAAFSHRLVVAGISGFLDATASCRPRESEIRPPTRSSRFFDLFPFRSGRGEIPGRGSRVVDVVRRVRCSIWMMRFVVDSSTLARSSLALSERGVCGRTVSLTERAAIRRAAILSNERINRRFAVLESRYGRGRFTRVHDRAFDFR